MIEEWGLEQVMAAHIGPRLVWARRLESIGLQTLWSNPPAIHTVRAPSRKWQLYLPFVKDLPAQIDPENGQPFATLAYHEDPSVTLDAQEQEIKLKIPVEISAQQNGCTWKEPHRGSKRICSTHYSGFFHWLVGSSYEKCHNTHGVAKLVASTVLQFSVNLPSLSFRWQSTNKVQSSSKWGSCLHHSPRIENYDTASVIGRLRDRIMKSWTHHEWRPVQVLDLTDGARLILHFHAPRVEFREGATAILGSAVACIQDRQSKTYVSIRPENGATQTRSRTKPPFVKYHSNVQQVLTPDFQLEGSLIFRWEGSSNVSVRVSNDAMQVTAHIIQEKGIGHMNRTTRVSLQASQEKGVQTPSSSYHHWWRRFVPSVVSAPRQQSSAPKWQTTVVSQVQNKFFWLSVEKVDDDWQMISLGQGRIPGQDPLLQKKIPRGKAPLKAISLSSFDQGAEWYLDTGNVDQVCGLPTTLTGKGRLVRISTQLFQAMLTVQSGRVVKRYVSTNSTTFRNATLNYSLEVGEIEVKMERPKIVKHAPSNFLHVAVVNSSTVAQCSGRSLPILAASLDHFQGSATCQGRWENGNLALSMKFLEGDLGSHNLKGLHVKYPSVPVAPGAATAGAGSMFARLLPDVNHQLRKLALVIPPDLAQYIPCQGHESSSVCGNLKVKQLPQCETGFLEFAQENAPTAGGRVPETLLAASPPNSVWTWALYTFSLLKKHVFPFNFDQQYPVTSFSSLAVWLALTACLMWRSRLYGVSWLMLSILLWSWNCHGPFAAFTVEAFQDLSGLQQNQGGVESVVHQLQYRTDVAVFFTLLEMILVVFWAELPGLLSVFRSRMSPTEKDSKQVIAYWGLSAFVIVSQFWLLVGVPMTLFLGRDLGTEVDDNQPIPSSPMHVIEVLLNLNKKAQIHHITRTVVSCSFTAVFVSFIGLYFIFFMLALPPGAFMAILTFVAGREARDPDRTLTNTATLCVLITELLSFATILGPFIIAYQILGGTGQWWLACALVGICGPLFAVPYCMAVPSISNRKILNITSLCFGLGYLGVSLVGAILLWKSANDELTAFSFNTSGEAADLLCLSNFTFAIYGANAWFVGSSAYMLLQDTADAAKLADEIQKQVSHLTWSQVVATIEDTCQIPCAGKLIGCLSHKSGQTLKSWWDAFFPWLVWLLEMDAVVSFLYHGVKVIWLGLVLKS